MVTPFDQDNLIDYEAVQRVVDFLLARGVTCLMVAGTTGEGMLLSLAERRALLEVVVQHVAGRAPVIAHTGTIGTAETVDLTHHAASAGAIAASVIVPYFFAFDDGALYKHFVSVAAAVPDFPVLLYTFPGNAKNDISPALLARLLTAAPNIVGIKSSSPDLMRFLEYIQIGGDGFLAFCGVDGLMLPALALGSRGQVSGNANVYPELFRALYDAFVGGNIELARSLQQSVNRIRAVLGDGISPAYFKAALSLKCICERYVRPPIRELTSEELERVRQGLHALRIAELESSGRV